MHGAMLYSLQAMSSVSVHCLSKVFPSPAATATPAQQRNNKTQHHHTAAQHNTAQQHNSSLSIPAAEGNVSLNWREC